MLHARVYNHVFEVTEDKEKEEEREKEVKAVEALLERLRKAGTATKAGK